MSNRTPVSHAISPLSVLLLGVAGATLSCADGSPTGLRQLPQPLIVAAKPGTTVACAPLPGDSVTVSIGPGGGKVAVGRHVLAVPKGALTLKVAITAVLRRDTVNVVRFQPEGLVFLKPATLTMYYGNCPTGNAGTPGIALVDSLLNLLEYVAAPPGNGPKAPFVQAALPHFSNYAVAWRKGK